MSSRYFAKRTGGHSKGHANFCVWDRKNDRMASGMYHTLKEAIETAKDMNHAAAAYLMDPSDKQDFVTDEIAMGNYRWCRARLFQALKHADEQGVLKEVLQEVVEESRVDDVHVQFIAALERWK